MQREIAMTGYPAGGERSAVEGKGKVCFTFPAFICTSEVTMVPAWPDLRPLATHADS